MASNMKTMFFPGYLTEEVIVSAASKLPKQHGWSLINDPLDYLPIIINAYSLESMEYFQDFFYEQLGFRPWSEEESDDLPDFVWGENEMTEEEAREFEALIKSRQ